MHKEIAPKRGVSQQSFSATLPYDKTPPERVPLLQAFELALSRCLYRAAGMNPPCLPKESGRTGTVSTFYAAECGVYLGHSLVACGQLAKLANVDVKFFGLDTFTGLPDLSERDRALAPETAPYRGKQFFSDTSVEAVQGRLERNAVAHMVKLVPGFFRDTLPELPDVSYFFVNIDCDLYESHIECLEYFYPRVAAGGIIFFDDYHSADFPMARAAIDGFMRGKPEQLFHLRYGADGVNHTKAFVVKY